MNRKVRKIKIKLKFSKLKLKDLIKCFLTSIFIFMKKKQRSE